MGGGDVPRFAVHLHPQIDAAYAESIHLAIQLGEEGGVGDVAVGAAPLHADALAEQSRNFHFFVLVPELPKLTLTARFIFFSLEEGTQSYTEEH